MGRVVIRDVADRAGVSRASVSNYLNHPEVLSSEIRERIANAIDELGFVPSIAARQLRSGSSSTVGYIPFEADNAYFWSVARGIERSAEAHRMMVTIGNSLGQPSRELEYLRLFEQQRVAGIIIAPVGDLDDELAAIRRRGTPVVVMGRTSTHADQPTVSVADQKGGSLAAQHLIDVGCRRLAFVGGPLKIQQVRQRLQGAAEAAAQTPGVSLEMVLTADRSVSAGRRAGEMLVRRERSKAPDGIFAVNDAVAAGVLQALHAAGIVVPDEVAVIGYDDASEDSSTLVPLSSIRTPHEQMGEAAFQMVTDQAVEIEGDLGDSPLQRVFDAELVQRASTAKI